jgi:uncharacterized membrane-anchored protein
MLRGLCLGIAAALCAAAHSLAEPQLQSQSGAAESRVASELRWRSGEVSLGDGFARLSLTPEWRFLGPDDAQRVLVDVWHNPPRGEKPLGMLFPADSGPLDPDGWGVLITYSADGHVSDSDAEHVDYDSLLHDLQADTESQNEERVRQGYPRVELIGWAARPHYDRESHKLHWARELRFDGDSEHALNYDVRVLGRRGVLVMKAIADMSDSDAVQARMRDVLAQVEFAPGQRYEDFDSGVDTLAAYGVGGLVAGGLLAKAGFFKMLLGGLLAAKKFIAVGVLAAGGALARYRRRRPA